MTKEQYEAYEEYTKQIDDLDEFLYYCGVCYESSNCKCMSKNLSIIFHKFIENFKFKYGNYKQCEITVPKPLQVQIAKLVYEYKKGLEKKRDEL